MDICRGPLSAALCRMALAAKGDRAVDIRPYETSDFDGVSALWDEAFPNDPPWNRAEIAIPEKLAFQPDLLFVAVEDGGVVGSVMAGYDGHRGWLYSVAVGQGVRRGGVGTALVRHAEQALQALGCAKVNLQVRATNGAVVRFYERLGYAIEERMSLGKRLQDGALP
jgi:ribosomal protein S18 acetylase RimI-like enzyme